MFGAFAGVASALAGKGVVVQGAFSLMARAFADYRNAAIPAMVVALASVEGRTAKRLTYDNYGVSVAFASYMRLHAGLLISLLSKVECNYGVQVGVVNSAGGGGLQIGVYNHAEADWSGVQIGLVNCIENGGTLPLVNWRF